MNIQTQECHGLYLYGSGYSARDDIRVSEMVGEQRTFCANACPKRTTCERAHRGIVALNDPQGVELYERQVREAKARGVSEETLAVMRLKAGQPDPFYRKALANFKQGAADRRVADAKAGRP